MKPDPREFISNGYEPVLPLVEGVKCMYPECNEVSCSERYWYCEVRIKTPYTAKCPMCQAICTLVRSVGGPAMSCYDCRETSDVRLWEFFLEPHDSAEDWKNDSAN